VSGLWKWAVSLSAVVASAALVYGQVLADQNSAEDRAVVACRARRAAAVTDAGVDRDIADAALNRADAALTLSIGAEVGVEVPADAQALPLAEALALVDRANRDLDTAERDLRTARDARVAFEDDPTGEC
jgi:hypothetical protein